MIPIRDGIFLMYNHIIYDIDSKFDIDKEFIDLYKYRLQSGIKYAKQQKIVILSIIRNISNEYKYALNKVKELLTYFHAESSVCLYENDSIDLTQQLAQEYISKNNGYNNFYLFSGKLNEPYLPLSRSKIRTHNIALARNKCLNLSLDICNDPDYYIVLDMDFLNLGINGILNSFGWLEANKSISAICGNSYIDMSTKNRDNFHNYDSFAFRLNYWDYHELLWFPYFNLPIGSPPIPVYSGFGGSCIYKQNMYEPIYGGDDCEHVILHKNLKSKFIDFSLYYNPSQIMLLN